ncbi:MAG: copper resistance protein CopC [Acidimicrobiales bacterium]
MTGVVTPQAVRARRLGVAVLLVSAALVLWSAPVAAHSFLVTTDPVQGARLDRPPDALVLVFSQPVEPSSLEIEIRPRDGRKVAAGTTMLADGGVTVRVALPELAAAVYVVAWGAVSAVDAHGSAGEFAFAVGDVTSPVPRTSAAGGVGWGQAAAGWLFVVGFAVAAGGLVVARLARAQPDSVAWERPRLIRLAAGAAVVGAVLAALVRRGGAGSTLAAYLAVAMAAEALATYRPRRRHVVPLVALFGAAAAWAARSHSAAASGVVGATVDFVHLAAGGVWAGSLLWMAVGLACRLAGWRTVVTRYARAALVLVCALAAAGVISAIAVLPGWAALWETGYGRLVLFKVGLLAGAVVAAAANHWLGLRRARLGLLQRGVRLELAVVTVAIAVGGLLASIGPPAPASDVEVLLGPPPLAGPTARNAGLGGQLNVDLATDGRRLDIFVRAVSRGISGTRVDVEARYADGRTAELHPRPCGPGCFTQALVLPDGATVFAVTPDADGWEGGTYTSTLHWPPGPPAADRLRRVIDAMRSVPTVTLTETTSSGPGTAGGGPFTLSLPGRQFVAAEPYEAGNLDDVRLVPGTEDTIVAFIPGSQILVELALDGRHRIVSERLVTPGHEVTRTFTYPDAAP